ncbi:MAG: class I adenylate-forming enzyme family protein [Vicinamibacterales bacterium]|nr:class I adenylate-forming enzyme family protein [Vicinamibacterales bacterium]
MTSHLVHHFLERTASRSPDQLFLIHGSERITYGDLDAGSNRLARLLCSAGIRRGDRVGLLALNSRLYVESYYAILKAGAVAVPLNTAMDGATLRQTLADCSARALLAGPRFEKLLNVAITGLPELDRLVLPDPTKLATIPARIQALPFAAALDQPATPPPVRTIDLDLASIVYTSGSTGAPRGVMLSHLNLVANTRAIVSYLELSPADRVLAVLPFYYVYGKSLLNTHAAAGGTVVIENRFLYPSTALETLEQEACSGLAGVPSTYAILLNKSAFPEMPLPSLRYMTQAGGPMAPELTRRLLAAKPGVRLYVMYGATEAGARLSYLHPDDLPTKLGSIGKAIPNVELRVLRDDGTPCEADETGEIVARGSTIMDGYWGAPAETAQVLSEHGYHTGDLGRCDADGYFWIVGRKKDIIKACAHRISAQEIEHAMLEFPEVHEAAVIGVPDDVQGEAIKAFVVFRGDPAVCAASLEQFLKKRLPAYKWPSRIEAVPELPKNEAGKIMKQRLREA